MSDEEGFGKFRKEIEELKENREKRYRVGDDSEADNSIVERVMSEVEKIVKEFVGVDRFLEIQSTSSRGIYVVYANVRLLGIWAEATNEDHINVNVMKNSETTAVVYSGNFNKSEIRESIQETILHWYRSLM